MITTEQLTSYQNGNVQVSLFTDGTKVREWPFGEAPQPASPESVDIKITDYCDAGCGWCHEQSTEKGTHASFYDIDRVLASFPAGVEFAIGGGNPLAYPQLGRLLQGIRDRGQYANLTVNQFHLEKDPLTVPTLNHLHTEELVRGIGISFMTLRGVLKAHELKSPNVVIHMIAGVHDFGQMRAVLKEFRRLLVLGYKKHGRGKEYAGGWDWVDRSIRELSWDVRRLLGFPQKVVCFDNLALEQLDIRRFLTEEAWQERYMGDDGTHTGYIDFVRGEFARTSYSTERFPLPEDLAAGERHWLLPSPEAP